MIEVTDLPAVNASLNATAGVLMVAAYVSIRQGRRELHGWLMGAAVVVSILFLCSYLYYHFNVTGVTRYAKTDWTRPLYFFILISHTILAMIVALWLVPVSVWRAARRQFDRHKRIAKWAFPIWLYVSITGVLIYVMLYQL